MLRSATEYTRACDFLEIFCVAFSDPGTHPSTVLVSLSRDQPTVIYGQAVSARSCLAVLPSRLCLNCDYFVCF